MISYPQWICLPVPEYKKNPPLSSFAKGGCRIRAAAPDLSKAEGIEGVEDILVRNITCISVLSCQNPE